MGAYIFFKTASNSLSDANKADQILQQDPFNQVLRKHEQCMFNVSCKKDLEWAIKSDNAQYWIKYYQTKIGQGDYKVSSLDESKINIEPNDKSSFFEQSTLMFERLNQAVPMKYFSSSCAFSGDYYTIEQIARITKDGSLLSGNDKEKIQALFH